MKSPNRENCRRWLHCGGRLIWMSAALSGFVLSAQAQIGSEEIFQPIGGRGGSPFRARCPPSDVLTGVELWTGDQVDLIKPICIPAVVGQFQEYPLKFGGGGGVGPQQFVCPNDAPVVIAMKVASEPNGIVRHIHLYCGRAVATPQRAAFPLAVYDGPAYKWGTDCNIVGGGCNENNGGAQSGMLTCSAGSVGVGIVGKSGKFLDALGLICDAPPVVLLPPIVVAMPPPPDPLADEVQDLAQGDGAGDTAIPHPDLAVTGMDGSPALQSGLSGTFVVTVKNAGNVVAPLELGIVFAGKLDQTGQIIAGASLACDVVHDTGINAAIRCLGGQLPAGGTTTVTVQGRGQPTAGTGMLVGRR